MNDDRTASPRLTWTADAQTRLEQVPQGHIREMTRQRVEVLAQQRGQQLVTVDLMEDKYSQWAEGSAKATSETAWTEEAQQRVERIPVFVRGMVVKAIEEYALSRGLAEITPSVVDEAKMLWGETGQFHQL